MNKQAEYQQAILDDPSVTKSKPEIKVRHKHFAGVETPDPPFRRLRGYAFDPSLSTRLDTAFVNEIIYQVRWEKKSRKRDEGLMPGPVGEYVEVVDYDPASECFYNPVDLSDELILAQDGLMPSEGNPQFHQQMVYAVIMTTIANFERALGRKALWSAGKNFEFVRRLRVYPHALREANAYYSPEKKALLFGYFPASGMRPGKFFPGGMVFTCLSHDIIAHETTHALLDGTYAHFVEASHPDSLAFHEAFADIVALFQHFTFRDVLRHQIGKTRGNLKSQNLLGELAQQFGEAIGNYGALRSAIVKENPQTGQLERFVPDPDDYKTIIEPHGRGAILVAAVFDAFIAIYERRVADLLRIASSGTGILPEGELHPDLVNRLAEEAARSAQHVLNVCIRALDYCPPVDINFGDYLRAMITADRDLVANDEKGYRIAIIEAFRGRGIYPRDIRVLSTESLCWPKVDEAQRFFKPLAKELLTHLSEFSLPLDRHAIFLKTERISQRLNMWIKSEGYRDLREFSKVAGIRFDFDLVGMRRSKKQPDLPTFQIHSLRPARRIGPDGRTLNQLIMSIVQTRDVPIPDQASNAKSKPRTVKFRGGSTLILDLATMRLEYAITKRIDDESRLNRLLTYQNELEMGGSLRATYFKDLDDMREPFAVLHRSTSEERL
ncbi:MAG: hypothetical protein KF762_18400 [Acidobacteria bacterium]|nr:hypothetical protein [Acidobacteriota bacterium]